MVFRLMLARPYPCCMTTRVVCPSMFPCCCVMSLLPKSMGTDLPNSCGNQSDYPSKIDAKAVSDALEAMSKATLHQEQLLQAVAKVNRQHTPKKT